MAKSLVSKNQTTVSASEAEGENSTQHLYAATFAKRLRELREAKGLSKSDLAKKVWGTAMDPRGYTVAKNRDRISVYEDGKQIPNLENLKALAEALDVHPGDLAPDIVTNTTVTAKRPSVSMTIVDGHPDRAVLTINTQVSIGLAAQIIQMVASDPVAAGALK